MTAENITYEISVGFYQGDEDDITFADLKKRVKKNFEDAKIVAPGSSEARIFKVKIKK